MDPSNAIEIRNISKSFKITVAAGDKKTVTGKVKTKRVVNTVLDDISLDIKKGEVLGILGRNGSGKSTFLSILARIMEPDSGTIKRTGKLAAVLELGMGFHPDMSGRDNIYTKGELYGFSKKEMDSKIETIIDYSGIRKYIDNPVRTYSSGMSGRLAFSIMVNVESDIILVDEVLSVGDAAFSSKARQHFIEMAESGKTVLIVSHNIKFMEDVCTRAIWIENGKIALDGPADEVCIEYQNKINESPEIVYDLAQSGVADAQYKLAQFYRDGNHFEKDPDKYRYWIESAAVKKNVRAQVVWGDMLLSEGKEKEALEFYHSAAERGDVEARTKVAVLSSSKGADAKLVSDIFKGSYARDDPVDEHRYAQLLLNTAWSDSDRGRAFVQFAKAADDGNLQSMYQVALMCRDGIGTSRDYHMMEGWLERAANIGHMGAITLLADIYAQGRLLPKDVHRSFDLSLRAAELGNRDFMYRVAVAYRDGNGTDKDTEKAAKWFSSYELAGMYDQLIVAERFADPSDKDLRAELLEKTLCSMNPESICEYLELTDSAEKRDQLIGLLRRIATAGNTAAILRLSEIYADGKLVERNEEESKGWLSYGSKIGSARCRDRLGMLQ